MNSSRPFSHSHVQTRALLSIRPQFADAILRGEKRYEFRRVIFARAVNVVVVYVTVPVKRVVAEFDVLRIVCERVSPLWRLTKSHAGINKRYFHEYFQGREYGYAIEVGQIRVYDTPVCPMEKFGLRPPQSFAYINTL
jgi:predicted transcriptional regulator